MFTMSSVEQFNDPVEILPGTAFGGWVNHEVSVAFLPPSCTPTLGVVEPCVMDRGLQAEFLTSLPSQVVLSRVRSHVSFGCLLSLGRS